MKEEQIKLYKKQVKKKSDQVIDYFLIGFYCIGLLLAFYYDTWLIAGGVGSLSLIAYYSSKFALPDSNLYQYVLSAIMGIFMAQFIYQMHGMFEMHFFAFIGSAILITYRNWKLQIPLALVVVLHHAAFGYLQFVGFDKIYFTQLEYMTLETFLIHGALATFIFLLCGFWAHSIKKSAEKHIDQSFEIGKLHEINNQKEALLTLSRDLKQANDQLTAANTELSTIFNNIDEVLFSVDRVNNRIIQMSIACEKIYGYTAAEFIAEVHLLDKMVHPEDSFIIENDELLLKQGDIAVSQYRILHKNKSIRWVDAKLVPSYNQQGSLIRVDGIVKDITQKVILEDALAIERQLKQQEITEAVITAQEEQLNFLGEELHDNINPLLATIKLYMESAVANEDMRVSLLHDSKSFISTAMEEIRTLSKSLVAPSLGEVGLLGSLDDMIATIMRVNNIGLFTKWGHVDEDLLDEKIKLAIFRITQEQLNNIFKHAKAKNIYISLEQNDTTLQLKICDDGVGFDSSQKRKGVGIQNIISRAELCQGKVTVNSVIGAGCELSVLFLNIKSAHRQLSRAS